MTMVEVIIETETYNYMAVIDTMTERLISRYGLQSRISQALALLKEEFDEAFEDEDLARMIAIGKIMSNFEGEEEV